MSRRDRRGQVFLLFGLADRDRLPATALVALLAELGMTSAGARSLLARMVRDGALSAERIDGRVHHAPSGPSRHDFLRLRDRRRGADGRWSGRFYGLLATVPEQERAFRDELRRRAGALGFGLLRAGVLIHVADMVPVLLRDELREPPTGVRLLPARLEFSTHDAREAASEAWALGRVDAQMRGEIEAIEERLPQTRARAGVEGLAGAVRNLLPGMAALLGAPVLPPALLPADWPQDRLVEALDRVHRAYRPVVAVSLEAAGASATDGRPPRSPR